MYGVVPAGVLCFPGAKRAEPEVRWALRDMADCAVLPSPVSHAAFVPSDGEVRVRLHGFAVRLPPPRGDRPRAVLPIRAGDDVFFVRQNLSRGNLPWAEVPGLGRAREVGLLLGQDPPKAAYDGENLEPRRPRLEAALAAMVAIVGRRKGVMIVEYPFAVSVVRKGSSLDEHSRVPWSEAEKLEKEVTPLEAEVVPLATQWRIVLATS